MPHIRQNEGIGGGGSFYKYGYGEKQTFSTQGKADDILSSMVSSISMDLE